MDKFEYKILPRREDIALMTLEDSLNVFGQDGWELVAVSNGLVSHLTNYIFKRKVEDTDYIPKYKQG